MLLFKKLANNCLIIVPFTTCCALPFWPLPIQLMLKSGTVHNNIRAGLLVFSLLCLISHFILRRINKYPSSLIWKTIFIALAMPIIPLSIRYAATKGFAEWLDFAGTIMFILFFYCDAFAKEKRLYTTTSVSMRRRINMGKHLKTTHDVHVWESRQKSYCWFSVVFSTLTLLLALFLQGSAQVILCAVFLVILILGHNSYGDWILVEKR